MSAVLIVAGVALVALVCGVVDTLREMAMYGRVIGWLIANPVTRNK